MKLTAAMCTHNPREAVMRRALDAIVAQVKDLPSAEVLVIDNNSSTPLAEREWLAAYPIRLISEPKPGLTAAREAAIANAEGDVMVFIDDDNVLGDRYLATVLDMFTKDAALGVLGGRVLPEYDRPPPVWLMEFERWLAIRRYSPDTYEEVSAPPYTDAFPIGAGLATRTELARAWVLDYTASADRIEGRRGTALSSGEDLDFDLFALSQHSKLAVTGKLNLTHVISGDRLTREYIERLAVANIQSSLELQQKWSQRFAMPLGFVVTMPLVHLLARLFLSAVRSPWSERDRIRRRVFVTLFGIRVRSMFSQCSLTPLGTR